MGMQVEPKVGKVSQGMGTMGTMGRTGKTSAVVPLLVADQPSVTAFLSKYFGSFALISNRPIVFDRFE